MQHDHIAAGELFRLSPRSTMHHVLCIHNIWGTIEVYQRLCLHEWSDISLNDSNCTSLSSFCNCKRF